MTRPTTMLLVVWVATGCYASSGGDSDDGVDAVVEVVDDGAVDSAPDLVPDVVVDVSRCSSDAECGAGRFCQFEPGACAPPGSCTGLGSGDCPAVYAPVCGCDGVTYSNDCMRIGAGVSALHPGECMSSGCFPGDPFGVCGAGEYCEGPPAACDLDGATGWCASRPVGCDDFYDPVCGCDGNTYSSDCDRQMRGVWLDHAGVCGGGPCQPGDPYGDCDEGEICEGEEGQCDVMGVAGWCQEPDDSCGWLYDPVCGCDETTYANDCERQQVGVWRRHRGACEGPPPPPG